MFHKDNNSSNGMGVVRLLSSMKTGLLILFLLGAAALVGSLIPQGQSKDFYTTQYGDLLGSFILLLSLNKLYSAWWFIALGLIFGIIVLICSIKRIGKHLGYRGYGSIILHLSMIVILAGAFVSAISGHREHIELGVGDSIDLFNLGFNIQTLSVEDFEIEYYNSLEPKQYYSKLSLSKKDGKQVDAEISVNHPLKLDGVKVYQHSYGWMVSGEINTGNRVIPFDRVNGSEIEIDENTIFKLIFIPDFDERTSLLQSKTPHANNPTLACGLMHHNQLMDVLIVPAGETSENTDYTVTFNDFRYFTGLEVKQDAGVPLVYAGFISMLAGFFMRYLLPERRSKGGQAE